MVFILLIFEKPVHKIKGMWFNQHADTKTIKQETTSWRGTPANPNDCVQRSIKSTLTLT